MAETLQRRNTRVVHAEQIGNMKKIGLLFIDIAGLFLGSERELWPQRVLLLNAHAYDILSFEHAKEL